ncbi:MAG: hypothetical protein U9R31_04015 [Candidatus Omnitrophota bacterium]|nr:hypothetical protein [Candidatus Omnitrophota bacterium]
MQRRGFFYLFAGAVVIIALIITGIIIFKKPARLPVIPEPVKKRVFQPEFHKGISYIAWTEEGYSNVNSTKAMEELVSLGVEWVGLLTTWYQDSPDTVKIYRLRKKTPSDESLLFAIEKLHDLGLKIMLKPHLDLVKSGGKWRGEIGYDNLAEWQAWFASYTDFILYYARLAEQENVELFCVGTELTNATLSQPGLWRDLINKVRKVYQGRLTYAANWYNEFDNIEFWDELDYAGIDPYFPLINSSSPTKEELVKAWKDWLGGIEAWQKEINKPVIFTEIGYKSSQGSADEPWQHSPAGKVDLQLQADCYEALLASFYEKPWFYGIYWWYWGVNPKIGGKFHRGFTPQNKPAREVIKQWYKKPASSKVY